MKKNNIKDIKIKLLKNFESIQFMRIVWNSEDARDTWEGELSHLATVVSDLEYLSVTAEHRECAWRTIDAEELPAFTKKMNAFGLITTPVRYVGKWEGFSHKTIEPEKGKPKNVSVVISKRLESAIEFREAYENSDNATQGELLGFPKCCIQSFRDTWEEGYVDPIWQIAMNTRGVTTFSDSSYEQKAVIETAHPYSNPLLRYIGLRVGFHIPCSFDCKETIALSEERMQLAEEKDRKVLTALLSMPVTWDSVHGIGIIKTPIFTLLIQSNSTEQKFAVEVSGKFFPKESSSGNCFPYRRTE